MRTTKIEWTQRTWNPVHGCAWLGNGRKDAGKCKRRRVEGDWLPIWAVPKCDVRKDKNIDQ